MPLHPCPEVPEESADGAQAPLNACCHFQVPARPLARSPGFLSSMQVHTIPEDPEEYAAEAPSPSPRIPYYSELTCEATLARLQAMENIRMLLESVQLQTNQMAAVTPNIQMRPVPTETAQNTEPEVELKLNSDFSAPEDDGPSLFGNNPSFGPSPIEMLLYHRPMSYDSLKSIVPHLQLSQRLELSFFSRIVHGINRHASFSVSFLKFHQTYIDPRFLTGLLFVDSVEYWFHWNERDHVEIRCFDRKIVSKDRNIALRYFEHFLRTSVLPVRQLELIQCEEQFHNFHGIPIPRLKIQKHPDLIATILGFPTGHRMEMVELIDSRFEDVDDVNISAAHLIKFSTKLRKHENCYINALLMLRLVAALNIAGTKAECRIKMSHVEPFTFVSLMVLTERIQIGSYVTGVFDKTLKVTDLYNNLLYWFHQFSPKVTKMNEKDCVVLRETETFTSVAIRDYFDTDSDQHCISFTSINIPKGPPDQLATTPVGPRRFANISPDFF